MIATRRAPRQIGRRRLGQSLAEAYYGMLEQHGPEQGQDSLREIVHHMRKKGQLPDAVVSLRALAEGILGENFQSKLIRHKDSSYYGRGLMESQAAIDVSAFSNITGQLFVDRVLENYNNPDFIGDSLMTTVPVVNGNLSTHKEPWLSRVYDEPSPIQPGGMYPLTQFKEQYITLPAVGKYGEQLAVTIEMVVSDLTRQAMSAADDVGRKTRQFKERLQLCTVAGLNVPRYQNGNTWNYMGTGYNTYQTSLSAIFTNAISGATVTDYTGIANLELLFSKMVDLATGDPIDVPIMSRKILCTPDKEWDFRKIFRSTDVLTGAFPTSGATNVQTHSPNPLEGTYPVVASKYFYHLLTDAAPGGLAKTAAQAKETFHYGDFGTAFVWREVEPFQTWQAPPLNEAEFQQDIILRVKTRLWGNPGVEKPQLVTQSYNT